MDKTIESTLLPGEKVLASTWGRIEMAAFGGGYFPGGGMLFPSQGILVATDRRILYFEKTHQVPMELVREMPYEGIAKFTVYPDIMLGLAGLISKVLHLQPDGQEPVRLIGPVAYKDFADVLKARAQKPIKGRVW